MKYLKIFTFDFIQNYDYLKATSFFRKIISIVIIFYCIVYALDFNILFGKNAVFNHDLVLLYNESFYSIRYLSDILYLDFYALFKIFFLILFVSSFFLFFFNKWYISLISFISFSLIFRTYLMYAYGFDFYLSMSLFYIVLFTIFSKSQQMFFRLFQFHVLLSYSISGLSKLLGDTWRNGESLWKALHIPYLSNQFFYPLYHILPSWFYVIASWVVIILQFLYPLWISTKWHKFFLVLNLFIHFSIGVLLNLPFFAVIMIIWNITAFYFISFNYKNDDHASILKITFTSY